VKPVSIAPALYGVSPAGPCSQRVRTASSERLPRLPPPGVPQWPTTEVMLCPMPHLEQ